MLKRDFYYLLKPYLPRRMRIALRRILARRKRKAFESVWPINETAGQPPAGWSGWPQGKKFAFVLTHDVEGPEGLARCQQLAEIEMELNLRSCFNFIPEGTYTVPPELRAWLTERGFEVGVHDLHHDGKLFSSQERFEQKATRINHYLHTWNSVGFRSGFMLRNLDWLHQLDVRYDCSTFDTDPFEPQPDAAGTIFPFWVQKPGQKLPTEGYVELPYTLPQDSTLFLILGENTPDIWIRKLDWVASRGGMALLNLHPDYLHVHGDDTDSGPTVREHYIKLLQHLKQTYGDSVWHALPHEISSFVRLQSAPAPSSR